MAGKRRFSSLCVAASLDGKIKAIGAKLVILRRRIFIAARINKHGKPKPKGNFREVPQH